MNKGDEDWIWLLKRYANGRLLCNCEEAYYNKDKSCEYGCSANKFSTKHELATKIREELEKLDSLTQSNKDFIRINHEI